MPPKNKKAKTVKVTRKQVEDEEIKGDHGGDEWENLDSELDKIPNNAASSEDAQELEEFGNLFGEEKSTVKRRIQLKAIRVKIYQEQLALLRSERAAAASAELQLLNVPTAPTVLKPLAAVGSFRCSICHGLFKTANVHKYECNSSKYGGGYLPPNLYKPISPRHNSSSLSNESTVGKMVFLPGIPLQGYRIGQCAFHPKELCPEQGDFCRSLIDRCLQIDPNYRREHFLPLIF